MSNLHRNTLSRRNFLRGIGGATLALPWLECFSATSSAAAAVSATGVPQRMAFYYVPIGVLREGFFPGEQKKKNLEGARLPIGSKPLELTPTLTPLESMKHKVNLLTGVDRVFQVGTDVHAQCASCFLSSAAPYSIKSSAWPLGRTLDHVVADTVGKTTPFKTLEFGCNSHKDNKESNYFDNISWYGTGHVAPSIRDPRKMYRRMFGTKEVEHFRNTTDLVLDDAHSLQRELGYADQQKFAEYFESIRTLERQMDRLEGMKSELSKVQLEEPAEAHLPRGEYIRMMGDLMIVALQTGLTNVATFMVGPERWNTPYNYETLFDKPVSHHSISHDQRRYREELLKIDRFHVAQYAYLLEKMDSIQEADGTSLLDNTIFTYGSGLGDGSTHQYSDLPIVVAGGTKKFQTGRHINFADGTPLANLWLTQAQAMGSDIERFADSTGALSQLYS